MLTFRHRTHIAIITIAGLLLIACANKENAMIKNGSQVSIHYTLTVDGQVVDTSSGHEPLQYTQGNQEIIPGLEQQLAGLKVGDKKIAIVSPEEGYGKYEQEALQKVPKTAFANANELSVGSMVSGEMQGQQFQAKVAAIGADDVTLDFNHPLAGKTLNFDVEVVKVTNSQS